MPQTACQPRAFERAFPQLACPWPLSRGAPQLSCRARPLGADGTRPRNVEDAPATGCSDFQLWFAPSCRVRASFSICADICRYAPNELARPAPLCAGERMARQQIWIALRARSRREPLAFVLFSGGISHAGSFCGLLLGVERTPLGQILWSMGKFPLLCQIGASVPLLPSLLAESLLAPALAWVSPLAMARPLLETFPAPRTLVRKCLPAEGATLRRLRHLATPFGIFSAPCFGNRRLHLWRELLFQIPF